MSDPTRAPAPSPPNPTSASATAQYTTYRYTAKFNLGLTDKKNAKTISLMNERTVRLQLDLDSTIDGDRLASIQKVERTVLFLDHIGDRPIKANVVPIFLRKPHVASGLDKPMILHIFNQKIYLARDDEPDLAKARILFCITSQTQTLESIFDKVDAKYKAPPPQPTAPPAQQLAPRLPAPPPPPPNPTSASVSGTAPAQGLAHNPLAYFLGANDATQAASALLLFAATPVTFAQSASTFSSPPVPESPKRARSSAPLPPPAAASSSSAAAAATETWYKAVGVKTDSGFDIIVTPNTGQKKVIDNNSMLSQLGLRLSKQYLAFEGTTQISDVLLLEYTERNQHEVRKVAITIHDNCMYYGMYFNDDLPEIDKIDKTFFGGRVSHLQLECARSAKRDYIDHFVSVLQLLRIQLTGQHLSVGIGRIPRPRRPPVPPLPLFPLPRWLI